MAIVSDAAHGRIVLKRPTNALRLGDKTAAENHKDIKAPVDDHPC